MNKLWLCLLLSFGISTQVSAQADSITLENAGSIEQIDLFGYGLVEDMDWSPDGKTFTVASSLGLIFYDAEQFERAPAQRWHLPEPLIHAIAYSPNGSLLATMSGDRLPRRPAVYVLRLWDVATGTSLSEWKTQIDFWETEIMFSPDGNELALAYQWDTDGVAHWDVSDPTAVVEMEPETWVEIQRRWYAPDSTPMTFQFDLAFSPDGTTAAYIASHEIVVLDPYIHKRLYTVEMHDWGSDKLLITPDSRLLISTARSEAGMGIIQAWDIATGELVFESDRGGIRALALHPSQSAFAYKTDYPSDVHYWQMDMGHSETIMGQESLWQGNRFTDVAFNADGSVLAALHGGAVEFWDVQQGIKIRDDLFIEYVENVGTPTTFSWVEFSPDGQLLGLVGSDLSGNSDRRFIYLMDSETLEIQGQISYEDSLLDLAFNPHGSLLATYHSIYEGDIAPNVAYIWDVKTVLEEQTTSQSAATIWNINLGPTITGDLEFSPDGTLLGLTGLGIEFWDIAAVLEHGEVGSSSYNTDDDVLDSSPLVARYDGVGPLAFSPNGSRFVTNGLRADCYLVIRSVENGEEISCIGENVPTDNPPAAYMFIGEDLLVSGAEVLFGNRDLLSTDLRIWDAKTGELVTALKGHFEEINDIVVSPDTRLIVSAGGGYLTCNECPSFDGSLRIWGVPS